MSLKSHLEGMLAIKGVTGAAIVSTDGFIVEGVSRADHDLSLIGGLVASSLASSKVLAGLMGEDEIRQTMIEYERGPVLMTPLDSHGVAGYVAVLTLDTATTLGRVRFQLRKMLPELAGELTS